MDKLNILANKELRRQVVWWTIGGGFFLIPLLYAVIANDFYSKLHAALEAGLEVTGFGIIGIFIGGVVVFNIKIQAVEDVRENAKEIDKSYTDLYDIKKTITQSEIPLALKYINDENYIGQVAANKLLTQTAITNKKNKLVVAQIKGKDKKVVKLNNDIKNLETNDMYDKKFKGLKPKYVLKNNDGLFNGSVSYRERYYDNPTATNWWLKIITTPLKFLTVAGSLVSGFALGISWEALILFYVSIIITTAVSSLITYILVARRVTNKTYGTNINMIAYIKEMKADIATPSDEPINRNVVEQELISNEEEN